MKRAALFVSAFLTPLILLSVVSPCSAKEHSRTFPQSCKVVKQTVRNLPKHSPYKLIGSDDKTNTITLATGGSWTGRRMLPLRFEERGSACLVSVNTVFSGLIHNDAGDLLKRIAKQLRNGPASTETPATSNEQKISPQNSSSSEAPLTDKNILGMTKAGLPASVIIAKMKTSTCRFDTSPAALENLKSAGVPDSVILAMVKRGASAK